MASNGAAAGVPTTIVFTLIISFFALFASVTCVTLYYYKRDPRRLERLRQFEQAAEGREIIPLGACAEPPIIWEVWADGHPKQTSKWEDLLPLNLTYGHDRLRTPALLTSQNRDTEWMSFGRTTDENTQHLDSNYGPRSNPATTDCNISVFITMPSPYKHPPSEFGGELAIGTAEVSYGRSEPPRP
ncbi:hypothetical protein BJ322DRAFT_1048150 [Thelephora terrestris]|uniref:Uncharacterized protein n=1 Tax=Thelephora terrestris TaxID=56493 RepID=A0A9P6HJ18_9AGAM|nr:hypothetical protein BJ322DRAFT_1048150 [Thelephora terrestris]